MSQAVDELTAQTGALFVIAAGNAGAEATMTAPGAADAALTVGAVDAADELAYFSSHGPALGDYAPQAGHRRARASASSPRGPAATPRTGWYQR